VQSNSSGERGIALFVALFALLIVTAIALGMVFQTGTETSLNGNYRDAQSAFYAARAGLEEARDRMRPDAGTGITINSSLPTALPGAANGVVYITNPGSGETVAPWTAPSQGSPNKYFDAEICTEVNCSGGPVPSTAGWYTTNALTANSNYAANPVLPYKWVRITLKTNQSASGTAKVMYVNGSGSSTSANYQVCWNDTNEFASATGCIAPYKPVYMLTALSLTPSGSRRMLQYEVTQKRMILPDAAIHTLLSDVLGDALNVTGYTDPVCAAPNTYGVKSGSSITVPGQGNVKGSPGDILPNTPFPYNLSALISSLQPSSSPIDSSGTGVTGSGTPVSYSGPQAVLGVTPTVTYDSSGAITAISNPGTPAVYYSPGNLTLGTSTLSLGSPPVSGQGVLVVNGNLTIDITNGFNYFGLILVTGDIIMTANASTATSSNIHGTIIGGGKFNSNLSNLSGSIFVHQNACFVQNGLDQSLAIVAFRELMY